MREPAPPAFLEYVPVALAFGTSGMRGLVRDLTDLEAYISVKGAIRYLLATGDIAPGRTVVLGGDLRPSTARILAASLRAVADCGCAVEYAGTLPTPALVLRCLATRRAGVMVTGSHIPFDRNGIKVNKSVGELLKSDEAGVLAEIARVRADEYGKTAAASMFDGRGMLHAPPALPTVDGAAEAGYLRRYVEAFPGQPLRGARVAFFEHSAVGRELVPRILEALGAEVARVGRSDTFVALDTENISDEALAQLQRLADGAGRLDAIVSTDGDSDRPLVAAVGDGRVRFLPGDLVGLVVAEYLEPDAVAVPVSANDAVEQRLGERGVPLAKTRIGSPYVIAALDEARARGARRAVGWEANGGFLVGSDLALGGGSLAALPTRDAVLPIVANLAAARARGGALTALWDRLPARFGRSGLIDEVPVATSRALLAQLAPAGATGEVRFDGGAVPAAWARPKALLEEQFGAGFGPIVRINVVDGVRIFFASGDVAHLRPSGNAPQLRIYANAGTQARADEIVALGLAEPDGILRRLERIARG